MDPQVVLISGASAGFGEVCAAELARLGHRVYGTSRNACFPDALERQGGPLMIPMDVRQEASVRAATDFVVRHEGRVDVVVNNAGVGLAGAIEDCSIEEARALFDTNFFGALRVCRAVLPRMREQHSGLIVNIGSLGGSIAIPFQGLYSASKNALAAMTDALRMELRPFGIRVTLLEPGDFKTRFTENRVFSADSRMSSPYQERCRTAVARMEHDEQHGADPRELAELLVRLVAHPRPRPHYRLGLWFQKLVAVLRPIVPAALFEKGILFYYEGVKSRRSESPVP